MSNAIYHIDKSYLENAEQGPFFNGKIPERPKSNQTFDFLGFSLQSPIGIPAGPLLNSRWIGLAADLGFDLLCYKTIRSDEHQGHPLPNIVYVDYDNQLDPANLPPFLHQSLSSKLAITNSFGMPSRHPNYLKQDIPKANSLLRPGQAMVVSVVGTAGKGDFIEDFVNTATFAKSCGAQIIEANFSCPNVCTGEGDIATNPESVAKIAKSLVQALGTTPLIIKVGIYPDKKVLREVLVAAAKAGVRAISGINTISMKIMDNQGKPALGTNRLTSGVCGNPIRQAALDFVSAARTIIDQEKLDLRLLACGGITLPEHFQEFLNKGADIAMTATGMMWDPFIAYKYHQEMYGKKPTHS